jgi:hypothetical protein
MLITFSSLGSQLRNCLAILLQSWKGSLVKVKSSDLGKSKFLAKEIDFLDHTIGKKSMLARLQDISAIENYIMPT